MTTDNVMITTTNPYWERKLTKEDVERAQEAIANLTKNATICELPKLTINTSSFKTAATIGKSEEPVKPQDKWIWVEGYKGTDKNMQGHGNYQFEIGKRYDMPLDVEIRDCHSGFHLSLNMKDVFNHYKIGDGNRFFKVRALVRERDLNEYGKEMKHSYLFGPSIRDKLASQSIEFIRELAIDEVFKDTEYADWSEEYKKIAMTGDLVTVKNMVKADELVELGYSKAFAAYVVMNGRYEVAKAVASQPELSMDMKALMIMNW